MCLVYVSRKHLWCYKNTCDGCERFQFKFKHNILVDLLSHSTSRLPLHWHCIHRNSWILFVVVLVEYHFLVQLPSISGVTGCLVSVIHWFHLDFQLCILLNGCSLHERMGQSHLMEICVVHSFTMLWSAKLNSSSHSIFTLSHKCSARANAARKSNLCFLEAIVVRATLSQIDKNRMLWSEKSHCEW